jgi:hypothetical protein
MNLLLNYICSLAAEGETALIVRQKPIGNELQFHADGAIKATWPAMLPTAKVKPDWAIYGNTASFIIDRFKDGHPSASAANCEYVLVMVLDDVGTEKVPNTCPLPPTWIMETSPGSFQWGYAFSEQPRKGEFAAAIKAIAEAGYTDKGAINAVRNFRLPGSINLKPGKDNFAAVLVEFNPEREYTLEDLCAAMRVIPGPVEAVYSPVRVADDGGDDVMAWLSDNGMVISNPNQEGWAGVICPNSVEHTDGNPEGRYLPSTRAFCCLHSHCTELTSRVFLDWVADNGGPRHDPGLRDELLTRAMDSALSKLTPTPQFPNSGALVVAETERKEMARLEKEDWYGRFAYVLDDDAYFDIGDRREVSRSSFNALFRHIGCKSIHNARKIEASACFDENREAKGAATIVGVTYAAGGDVFVTRDGQQYGNRWRDARPAPVAGDVSRWLTHLERLIPVDFEREHLLNVMAHKVQFPGHKINHAVLMGGTHGSGKDTLFAPFFWAIGGASKTNCSLVKNEDLTSQWGYALECEVMEIAELRQSEAKDRRSLENTLKPIIAAPPELLPINRKGLHPYMALNRVLVVAFSNERAAITISTEDRRWFCLWAECEKLPEAEAVGLWNWYKNRGGFEAVAHYLTTRDVSAFNPSAPPPMTEAKAIMTEQGQSMAEAFIVDLIERKQGDFARGVVASPFTLLCDRLQGLAPPGTKIPPAALMHALKACRWVDCGRLASHELPNKKHIFCAPDQLHLSKSELRRLAEAPTGARLTS